MLLKLLRDELVKRGSLSQGSADISLTLYCVGTKKVLNTGILFSPSIESEQDY